MKRVMVKICGLTRAEDVQAAIAAGADAIGFVFTASPRRISPQKAIELSSYIPEGVLRIGLFLDQENPEVDAVINTVSRYITISWSRDRTAMQCIRPAVSEGGCHAGRTFCTPG